MKKLKCEVCGKSKKKLPYTLVESKKKICIHCAYKHAVNTKKKSRLYVIKFFYKDFIFRNDRKIALAWSYLLLSIITLYAFIGLVYNIVNLSPMNTGLSIFAAVCWLVILLDK